MFSFGSRNDSKQYHSTQMLTDGRDQIQHISLCIALCGWLIASTFMLPDVRLLSFWYCRALHTVHFTMVNHSSINAQIGADTSC